MIDLAVVGICVQNAAGSWTAYRGCSALMDLRFGLTVFGLDDGILVKHYPQGDWLTIQPLIDARTSKTDAKATTEVHA